MKKPTVSIALCTYNGEDYLSEQLQSFLRQSQLPDELVVCDDCSQDGTAAIVEEFRSKAPFPVKFHLNEHNLGSTKNFERAIGFCSKDVVFFSDQDDVWDQRKIEKIARLFEDPAVGMAFSDATVVDGELNSLGYTMWQHLGFAASDQLRLKQSIHGVRVLLKRNVVTGAAMAFRTRYRDLICPIPEVITHDHWIAILIETFARVAFIDEPLMLYRQHDHNQIGGTSPGLKKRLQATDLRYLENQLIAFAAIERRIRTHKSFRDCGLACLLLEQKISHLKNRLSILHLDKASLRQVLTELIFRRYQRYSENATGSFLKDLSVSVRVFRRMR